MTTPYALEELPTIWQLLNALIALLCAFLIGVFFGYAAGMNRPPDVEDKP